jgi:hypothetical protein
MQVPASKLAGTVTYSARKVQTPVIDEETSAGPSNVVTFVRCLRLLDLDLREDWPGVTEHLFSAKTLQHTLQQRVKCVE